MLGEVIQYEALDIGLASSMSDVLKSIKEKMGGSMSVDLLQ